MQNQEQSKQGEDGISPVAFTGVLFILAAATLLLSVTGPFNTYGMGSFFARLLYWGGLVLSSCALAAGLSGAVRKLALGSVFVREAVIIGVFCIIFTPVAIVWTDAVFPASVDQRPSASAMFLYLVGICVPISTLRYGLPIWLRERSTVGSDASQDIQLPRFVRRLPDDFDGDILRLSGDGHYVNVLTTKGPYDVRIRLSDAVDEMDGLDGFWAHRSHWVARSAVQANQKEKGRSVLILTNGDTVPVGAKYKPDLEEAGVLDTVGG